jgi:hypothetical protein
MSGLHNHALIVVKGSRRAGSGLLLRNDRLRGRLRIPPHPPSVPRRSRSAYSRQIRPSLQIATFVAHPHHYTPMVREPGLRAKPGSQSTPSRSAASAGGALDSGAAAVPGHGKIVNPRRRGKVPAELEYCAPHLSQSLGWRASVRRKQRNR